MPTLSRAPNALVDRRHDDTAANRSASAEVVNIDSPVVGGGRGHPPSDTGGQDQRGCGSNEDDLAHLNSPSAFEGET